MTLPTSPGNTQASNSDTSTRTKPSWVQLALGFVFVPIFTVAVVLVFLILAMIFLVQSLVHGDSLYWWLFGIFASLAIVIPVASTLRRVRSTFGPTSLRYANSVRKPTLAIVILMIGVYSSLLTVGMLIFENFFAANRPGGIKFFVTLALAIASWAFMKLRGASVIRQNFDAGHGRNVLLSGRQALVVFAVVLSFGMYLAWLII